MLKIIRVLQGAVMAGLLALACQPAHAAEKIDEFIPASVIGDYAGMQDGDGILCFNFRADRAREILTALLDPGFDGFARARLPHFAAAVGLTEYSDALNAHLATAFAPQSMADKLGEVVARAGLKQLRMAETEKYPHVTFFLNGGEEAVYPGEERIMVPSPKDVATYDLKPEMSAPELTEKAVAAINIRAFDLIVLNYANADMVGHTGILSAAIKAVEAVDHCIGRVVEALQQVGGECLITADHGNAEQMMDPESGQAHTAHTSDPVPLIYVGRPATVTAGGILSDIAPTMLHLMGMPVPAEMTGKILMKTH